MDTESPPIPERGLLTLSDAAWAQAVLRSQVIAPLAALPVVGRAQADEAAAQLGLSRRRVYLLIRRYRQGLGVATDVAPSQSDGGGGRRCADTWWRCRPRSAARRDPRAAQDLLRAILLGRTDEELVRRVRKLLLEVGVPAEMLSQ